MRFLLGLDEEASLPERMGCLPKSGIGFADNRGRSTKKIKEMVNFFLESAIVF
jgi:hypothetical protein